MGLTWRLKLVQVKSLRSVCLDTLKTNKQTHTHKKIKEERAMLLTVSIAAGIAY